MKIYVVIVCRIRVSVLLMYALIVVVLQVRAVVDSSVQSVKEWYAFVMVTSAPNVENWVVAIVAVMMVSKRETHREYVDIVIPDATILALHIVQRVITPNLYATTTIVKSVVK